jgi:hypothetical protein
MLAALLASMMFRYSIISLLLFATYKTPAD